MSLLFHTRADSTTWLQCSTDSKSNHRVLEKLKLLMNPLKNLEICPTKSKEGRVLKVPGKNSNIFKNVLLMES